MSCDAEVFPKFGRDSLSIAGVARISRVLALLSCAVRLPCTFRGVDPRLAGVGGGGGVGRVEGEGVVLVVLSLFLLLLKFVSDAHVRVFVVVVVVVVGVVVGDESGLGRFSNTELAAIVADWYALALFSRSPWTSSKCSWLSNHSWSSCFAFSSCNGLNKGSLHCLGFVIVAIVDFVASVFFEAECPW